MNHNLPFATFHESSQTSTMATKDNTKDYMEIIENKTAILFAAATELLHVLSDFSHAIVRSI